MGTAGKQYTCQYNISQYTRTVLKLTVKKTCFLFIVSQYNKQFVSVYTCSIAQLYTFYFLMTYCEQDILESKGALPRDYGDCCKLYEVVGETS